MTPRCRDQIRLGRRNLRATAVGLGGGPLGGLFTAVSAEQADATVEAAWSAGVRLFDVAPLYGHGRSERAVGRVLSSKPREAFVLSTKVGRLLRPAAAGTASQFAHPGRTGPVFDFSADGVNRSLEESLERLGLDRIDVAYIHDPEEHLEQALNEAWPALVKLRDEGVVESIGVGTNFAATAIRFIRESDIDCMLLANRLNLLDQSGATEILPLCSEHLVSVVIGGVFASGILAAPSSGAPYDYGPAPPEVLSRVLELERVCSAHGVSLHQVAIQHPFRFGAVSAVLVGARAADEFDQAITALEQDVPDALWADLERHGVLTNA
jgi:D-threo-aldose 1-dehydrogenase